MREHNAIADEIGKAHPDYHDQRIFDLARLAVAAVVAKIHTIDWTPELLDTSILNVGMNANWSGLFGLGPKGLGLVGMKKAVNHGVPYALTEEFTAVYRLHPMIPDELPLEGRGTLSSAELFGTDGAPLCRHSNGQFSSMLLRSSALCCVGMLDHALICSR